MAKISAYRLLAAGLLLAGTALLFAAQAQTPPEPGAMPGVEMVNISKNSTKLASVFPQVAVSRKNPNLIAVAWRRYGLPIDTNALRENRIAECYVSISKDGGKTFAARNMMDMLRTPGGNGEPLLWGCNAPWVTIATDGTMYFGGALFTAGGTVQVEPKAGRAAVSVSTDNGTTWSKMVPGLTLNRFAPGLKGLNGGMNQENTPWDGADGIVDLQTGTFYSSAGAYFGASDDKGKSFQTVYQPNIPGWTREGSATGAAGFGTLLVAIKASSAPNAKCPCLVAVTSQDKGKTFTPHLVAQAADYSDQGTVRYPVPAADPATAGHFAIAAYETDHKSVKVYYTADNGNTWKSAAPRPVPAGISVTSANQVSVGYTTDGRILVTWRGFRNPSVFNTFVAMMTGDSFGPTVKATAEPSVYPPLLYLGNYGPTTGGGDFTTWVTGSNDYAFVATPYAPGGAVLDTYLSRIPLSLLK